MYLKKLEIQGFKSFADRTVLELKPGITLVVGPNGSGKSNILDAITWVLGEQSVKSLRGGKMEDVIFAGTDKRRSLGMAEVSLTIDNSSGLFPLDFHEVTVTRRLYRSGESDYLINRVPCRLRDVHELFMDTGVGREGFSIIGQGRIDEILSVKSEDRRGLIEEAAGIVKYRYRKREAVKKLEDTENNLIRLGDIIGELKGQEAPLAEQARVAAIYQELKAEQDALEIGLIIDEAESAARRLENITKNRLEEEQALEALRTKFYEIQSREEEAMLELRKKEEELALQQEKLYQENIRLEKNDSEIKLLGERLTEIVRQRRLLKNDIQELNLEYESLQKECDSHDRTGVDLKDKLQKAQDSLQAYEELLEKEKWQDQQMAEELENLKSEHFEALQEETHLHNEANTLDQRLNTLLKQEEQVRERKTQAGHELENLTARIDELQRSAQSLDSRRQQLNQNLEDAQERLQKEEERLKRVQKENRCLLDEKNNAATRHKVLLEMEREGQGYGQGVREILRLADKQQLRGVLGTVAQVISVPKNYEIAVEVVLGGSLQHLITQDEKVAQEAIGWLKKNERGRCTFLPLTTVKGGRPADNPPAGGGVIGRLNELIEFDARYSGIMENLLGRVWLVEDLDTAVLQARKTGYRYRIVTLDGQLVNPGGSLTGGSIKTNPTGILSRKRNMEELAGAIAKIEDRLQLGEREEELAGQEVKQILAGINSLREAMQDLDIKKVENGQALERWHAEQQRFCSEMESMDWQMAEFLREKAEVSSLLRGHQENYDSLRSRVAALSLKIQELQGDLKTKQAEKIKKNEGLTQLRIQVATFEEKLLSFEKESSFYKYRLKQLGQHRQEKEKELLLLKTKKVEMEETSRLLAEAREKLVHHLHCLEKELAEQKRKREELQENIGAINQEVKISGQVLKEKEEKTHQLELQLSKHETALEAALRRLKEQYELELEDARERYPKIEERRKSQERIGKIKEEIWSLGQVNVSAIEEYKKLKERLEFLQNQVQDMTEARLRLQQVIGEMDQIMTRKFNETFQQVDRYFQELFQRLFGGGRAQLVLTQPEEPLETGVDIIAQPPGKKPQTLSLLSGGEKALTAIALLMAVLKIKPSPFCVLDEIESNLDEANVQRFASMLLEFSGNTQFIVISHRKGTMEAADVLYGVTIEETGVSRLVSVRLEDAKQEAS